MERIKKWWEDNALEYQEERKIAVEVNYGPGSPNEDALNLLGNVEGKKILEIGCGGAQCGIALAKKGAKVIGMDISEQQLKYAKDLAKKHKVDLEFYNQDITNLKQIDSESQDILKSNQSCIC